MKRPFANIFPTAEQSFLTDERRPERLQTLAQRLCSGKRLDSQTLERLDAARVEATW
jgi:hypothetical protein